jgi:magnesium transporter
MRAADVAEAVERDARRAPDRAARLLAALPFDLAVQVLDVPELEHAVELLTSLARSDEATCTALVEAMSPDRRAALLRKLPDAERTRLLAALAPETRRTLERLLRYPATSAGGLMTTEFVTVPSGWTAEQAIRHVRQVASAMETVYVIYVVNGGTAARGGTGAAGGRLEHVLSLRELLSADGATPVGEIGDRRAPLTVGPLIDREEVARLIAKYNLLALPVVDTDGCMLGIVTVDDVIDAMVSEQTEDTQKFGGLQALDVPYTEVGIWTMTGKRAGWLTVLFLGEMLTATAMSRYELEIERAVVLALFVPLIISSGGNSGSQATTLVIRAMTLGELSLADWWRVALRELPSGLMLGTILGAVGALRIVIWQAAGWYDYGPYFWLLALTIGLALIGVVAFGSLAGAMLPFILRALGFDPVNASAPFVATLVDVTGLVIYFSIATLVLRGTML